MLLGLTSLYKFLHKRPLGIFLDKCFIPGEDVYSDQVLRNSIIYEVITQLLAIKANKFKRETLIKNSLLFVSQWLNDFELFYRAQPFKSEKIHTEYSLIEPYLSRCKHCFDEFGNLVPRENLCTQELHDKNCKSQYNGDFINPYIEQVHSLKSKIEQLCKNLKVPEKQITKEYEDGLIKEIDLINKSIDKFSKVISKRILHRRFFTELIKENFNAKAKVAWLRLPTRDKKVLWVTNVNFPPKLYKTSGDAKDAALFEKIASARGGIWEIAQRFPNEKLTLDKKELDGIRILTVPYELVKVIQEIKCAKDKTKLFETSLPKEQYQTYSPYIEKIYKACGLKLKLSN